MRGTIIMWSGDKGVIAAEGKRFEFDINVWEGTSAPATNATVDLVVTDGRLTSVKPVDESQVAKEKLAQVTGKGGAIASAILSNVGKDVAIAYAAFAFLAFFVGIFVAHALSQPMTLAEILGGDYHRRIDLVANRGSGRGVLVVLVVLATIAVPYFWKHRLAPLAFSVPLVATAYAIWSVHRQLDLAKEMVAAEIAKISGNANPFYQLGTSAEQQQAEALLKQAEDATSLGIGGWLLLAIAGYLAVKGIMRVMARA